jgi:hypothetical protein
MTDLKYRLSLLFIFTLLSIAVIYPIYKIIVKSQSEHRYTTCIVRENYYSSKDTGKIYEYLVSGKKYEGICTSQDCIDSKIGQSYLCKYWDERPDWCEILFDVPVSSEIVVPLNGWQSFQEYQDEIKRNAVSADSLVNTKP